MSSASGRSPRPRYGPRNSSTDVSTHAAAQLKRRSGRVRPSASGLNIIILWKPCPFRGRAPSQRGPNSVDEAVKPRRPRPVLPPGKPKTRFLERPDWPDPQSQSLSRSYGSRLPISLTHINLSTRGSKPRRPDAEMGTVCVETGSPVENNDQLSLTAAAPDCDPCDFLTCIFHGLALVHGTTQELCRSTATVWFIIPSSPSRFI